MVLVASVDLDGKKIIQVSGDIAYANLDDFRGGLFRSIEAAASMVLLDMSAVKSITADGMQVVLDMYAQYSQSHEILIINPSEAVNTLLLLTGLNNLMPISHRSDHRGVH
ncbi:MAG: STAS domain-containing protein [Arenicella sp.]